MWRALCTECAARRSLPVATVYSLLSLFEKMITSVHLLLSLRRFQNPWCQRATSTLSGPTRTDSKERSTLRIWAECGPARRLREILKSQVDLTPPFGGSHRWWNMVLVSCHCHSLPLLRESPSCTHLAISSSSLPL